MKNNNFIPKTTDDIEAISVLITKEFCEIKENVMILLEYMQDMHWDVSHGIAKYFSAFFNLIQPQIIEILKSNDAEWKYNVLVFLVKENANNNISPELYSILKRFAISPTNKEKEEEIDKIAKEILSNMKEQPNARRD